MGGSPLGGAVWDHFAFAPGTSEMHDLDCGLFVSYCYNLLQLHMQAVILGPYVLYFYVDPGKFIRCKHCP